MTSPRQQTDILVLSANSAGNADYIIGDLHGNQPVFSALHESCQSAGDRIFCAGDLIDRGKGNVEIIRAIVENNKNPGKGKIYCVHGNHEDMCIDTIDALITLSQISLYARYNPEFVLNLYVLKKMAEQDAGLKIIFKHPVMKYFLNGPVLRGEMEFNNYFDGMDGADKMSYEEKISYLQNKTALLANANLLYGSISSMHDAITCHQANGGQWLVDLYLEEFTDTTISATEDQQLDFAESSAIAMISNFLKSLPYIIRVEGDIPFNVVHADMPMGDAELLRRVAAGEGLTEKEKEYAMWARAHKGAEIKIKGVTGRNLSCALTIVGHSIDGSVRVKTNTINIDVAAYERDCALVIKMPDCEAFILNGENQDAPVDDTVIAIGKAVQEQLEKQMQLKQKRESRVKKKVSARLFKDVPENKNAESQKDDSAPADARKNTY